MNDLIYLVEKYPNLNITISLADLKEFGRYLIFETKREIEEKLEKANQEQFLTTKMASDLLGVDRSTLHRWQKQGYLPKIEVGGRHKYRASDIKKIIEGNSKT